jgi:hypothetical protein
MKQGSQEVDVILSTISFVEGGEGGYEFPQDSKLLQIE